MSGPKHVDPQPTPKARIRWPLVRRSELERERAVSDALEQAWRDALDRAFHLKAAIDALPKPQRRGLDGKYVKTDRTT